MEYKPLDIEFATNSQYEVVQAGVCSAEGFVACGVHAGFRKNPGRKDLALVVCDKGAVAAATFTRNRFCAAPVDYDREVINGGKPIKAIVVNTGIANAATGLPGAENARETAGIVAEALECSPDEVLVASTGVIGVQLPMDAMRGGVPKAVSALGRDPLGCDLAAAEAIMTTDTRSKRASVSYLDACGAKYTIGGMCKGSGMISPNMATMIAVVTTDAPVSREALDLALHKAVDASFNRVTVDSDTSTNDTCIALSSGVAKGEPIEMGTDRYEEFCRALEAVCIELAQLIASDGEGATKLVRVVVGGAANQEDADMAARTVANSPLVKTAVAGHDANWGRIAAALGRSGAQFDQYDVSIDIMGIPVCRSGLGLEFDEQEALKRFESDTIDIVCDLGAGRSKAVMWTCDLTHGYISINGDYRS